MKIHPSEDGVGKVLSWTRGQGDTVHRPQDRNLPRVFERGQAGRLELRKWGGGGRMIRKKARKVSKGQNTQGRAGICTYPAALWRTDHR